MRGARVNLLAPGNLEALVLVSMGRSNRSITARVGLSSGQIHYRMALGGLQQARRDFREGRGQVAAQVELLLAARLRKNYRRAYVTPSLGPFSERQPVRGAA
jgi:hypothetical protein